jgi:hypothetical protein
VGTPYQIHIPEPLDAKISSWNLPPDIRQEMEWRLRDDLGSDPVQKLVRVIDLNGEPLNVFSFTIPEPPEPNSTYISAFQILYADDERRLNLVDADYQPPESDIDDSSTPVL